MSPVGLVAAPSRELRRTETCPQTSDQRAAPLALLQRKAAAPSPTRVRLPGQLWLHTDQSCCSESSLFFRLSTTFPQHAEMAENAEWDAAGMVAAPLALPRPLAGNAAQGDKAVKLSITQLC